MPTFLKITASGIVASILVAVSHTYRAGVLRISFLLICEVANFIGGAGFPEIYLLGNFRIDNDGFADQILRYFDAVVIFGAAGFISTWLLVRARLRRRLRSEDFTGLTITAIACVCSALIMSVN